jgi:large subunit ribosomal protein L32
MVASAEADSVTKKRPGRWPKGRLYPGVCEVFMPNPKRRHSKARTSKRRAHDHLTAQSLSECPNCHERKMPHRACPKCGYYKGREVVEIEEAAS